jgi:hypothetical protein
VVVVSRKEADVEIEKVLARHLGPVRAPEHLWDRVEWAQLGGNAAPARRRFPTRIRGLAWAAVAAAVLMAISWSVPWRDDAMAARGALAIQALARGPQHLNLRSDDASELRAWVLANTGIELPMPAEASPEVRLIGASVLDGAGGAVEIAYRVGGYQAAMIVSKGPREAGARHREMHHSVQGGTKVVSWTMRGQLYTVACSTPGDVRVTCQLCHEDGERRL